MCGYLFISGGLCTSGELQVIFSTTHSGSINQTQGRKKGKRQSSSSHNRFTHIGSLGQDSLAKVTKYMLEKAILDEQQKQSIHPVDKQESYVTIMLVSH